MPPEAPLELRVDASYRNTNDWEDPDDIFNRFFRFADGKGINNTSGFRPKSRAGGNTKSEECVFCILVTTWGETEWPDAVDRENGLFTYYGDNRTPGKSVHDTPVGGNRLLEGVYSRLHTGRRHSIPPFLAFEKYKNDEGTQMRFLGLVCPGGQGISALDDLVAVWRVAGSERFQNYRSLFTILREETISHAWLEDLVSGIPPAESPHCPELWKRWVETGLYTPLECSRQAAPRSKEDQLPATPEETAVLAQLIEGLSDREFEFAAAALVQLMDSRFVHLTVTRAVRDGGRDVIGHYRVGHDLHQVMLHAYVEAKHWSPTSAIGVKPMMRLISRLKHRDVGVFLTTSFFDYQVQEELIEDGHPILLVSGGDIARLLIQREIGSGENGGKLKGWLEGVRLRAADKQAG